MDKTTDAPQVAALDPLVWHYERERRMKLDGQVQWEHKVMNRNPSLSFVIRVNFNFVANSSYLDVLIPTNVPVEQLGGVFEFLLERAADYANKGPIHLSIPALKEQAMMSFDGFPESKMTSDDCKFTGRIFVYMHYTVDQRSLVESTKVFRARGLNLIVRDGAWIANMQRFLDRPVVFLGHDSKDKDEFVRELATELSGPDIKVWYDEFSLKPGARLRKSLDDGLEAADYFVPVITENFLANAKFAQYEIDAILQKHITEKKPTILPVCVGVDPSRLKDISRMLADTVAIVHKPEHTVRNLAHQISSAVAPRVPAVGEPLPEIVPSGRLGLFSVGFSVGPSPSAASAGSSGVSTAST